MLCKAYPKAMGQRDWMEGTEAEIPASEDIFWTWQRILFDGHMCQKGGRERTQSKKKKEQKKERGGPPPQE